MLLAAAFTMFDDDRKETKEEAKYKSPNITEATEKDWEDFFSVQEENIFDR